MSICQLIWKDQTHCKNTATKRIQVTYHSRIYAGLHEVNNEKQIFDVCEIHHRLVKNERNVTTV